MAAVKCARSPNLNGLPNFPDVPRDPPERAVRVPEATYSWRATSNLIGPFVPLSINRGYWNRDAN